MPTGFYVIYNDIESNHNNMFIFIIWVDAKKKVIRANFKLFHLNFATFSFLVGNIIFSAIF